MIEDHQDDIDDKEKEDDKPKIPGIQNLGNTCYLSASLQTLFSIPQFLHNLYRSYEELVSTKEMPLTKALLEVATAIQVLKEADVPRISPEVARNKLFNSKAANPSALKKQMDVLTDKFTGYEQRDAHEFLGDLVDFLHDELADSPSDGNEDGEMKKLEESSYVDDDDVAGKSAPAAAVATTSPLLPTDEYFHLKVRVCLECKSCGYSRSKDELYRHLSVDVGEDTDGETWSVERSLQQFFQNEDREVKCEECESGTSATQTMEIISR
jgi:ubiquitin C-terminal hydrolase